MISYNNRFLLVTLLAAGSVIAACGSRKSESGAKKPAAIRTAVVDSSLAAIKFQKKQDWVFNNKQVYFSNRFGSARVNDLKQLNDSTFNIVIESENSPINPSPWYAFKVWSKAGIQSRHIYLKLSYPATKHRYDPKISRDGQSWTDVEGLKVSSDKKEAIFRLKLSADTLTVAAQEIIDTRSSYAWIDSLAGLPFVNKQLIGSSLLGKPIVALNTRGSGDKKMIVVLSRQHPPEVTGYMAMQEFVRTVLANTELAKKFRRTFEVVIIPMMNPDGVDEGNWRHNAGGVDLNRDWTGFKQPETKAVEGFLLGKVAKQQAAVYVGIDFHSTYDDVFYTNEDQSGLLTNSPGFMVEWLKEFEKSIPGFKANIKPSPNGGNVSKSWLGRVLKAEAVTYEVGDKTPRLMLRKKGAVAAETMMKLLLSKEK